LLTSGTSQSTVIALAAARVHRFGREIRANGLRDAPDHIAYCAASAHSANQKALELLGHGAQALRRIPTTGPSGGMDLVRLEERLATDRAAGKRPFCVIATVGSVDTGACDDVDAIADLCARGPLAARVDGAFGCWARIADHPGRPGRGLERADSLAFDFHKWMYVQYDCGAVLIRHGDAHRAAFATRPHYLEAQEDGLGGGDPWYCDYGIELSRGFRALKVWSCLRAYGLDRLAQKITDNCRQAARMARLVEAADELELGAPVVLNVCCFRYAPKGVDPQDRCPQPPDRNAPAAGRQGGCCRPRDSMNGHSCVPPSSTTARAMKTSNSPSRRCAKRARDWASARRSALVAAAASAALRARGTGGGGLFQQGEQATDGVLVLEMGDLGAVAFRQQRGNGRRVGIRRQR
jgi:glutamate/tyrosine decarboxylase-like PLP-dependent enzyme